MGARAFPPPYQTATGNIELSGDWAIERLTGRDTKTEASNEMTIEDGNLINFCFDRIYTLN